MNDLVKTNIRGKEVTHALRTANCTASGNPPPHAIQSKLNRATNGNKEMVNKFLMVNERKQ